MSGVTATIATVIILLAIVALGGLAAWFVIPIFLFALLVMLAGPVRKFFTERGQPGTEEPDVPTTSEASYDPVNESQR